MFRPWFKKQPALIFGGLQISWGLLYLLTLLVAIVYCNMPSQVNRYDRAIVPCEDEYVNFFTYVMIVGMFMSGCSGIMASLAKMSNIIMIHMLLSLKTTILSSVAITIKALRVANLVDDYGSLNNLDQRMAMALACLYLSIASAAFLTAVGSLHVCSRALCCVNKIQAAAAIADERQKMTMVQEFKNEGFEEES